MRGVEIKFHNLLNILILFWYNIVESSNFHDTVSRTNTVSKRNAYSEPPYPWTFDNDLFGGPDFWGLVSKEWRMCRIGRMQSPINIDPRRLLFDPHLSHLAVARNAVEATFRNTGQFPVISVLDHNATDSSQDSLSHTQPSVNISGGPAFPYSYRLHQAILHFGRAQSPQHFTGSSTPFNEENLHKLGSEHTVDQVRFPAEVQLLAFNSDLYENFSQAMIQPKGVLAISVIVDIGETTNSELRRLTIASQSITYKNRETHIKKFHAANLLPKTEHYVTYEGSLTFPGCYESVTWIVMNNPIYITREDLEILNELQQGEEKDEQTHQPLFMSGNYRPLKPLNGRLLRTNINSRVAGSCPSNIYLDMGYRANPQRTISSSVQKNGSTNISSKSPTQIPRTELAKEQRKSHQKRDLPETVIADEYNFDERESFDQTFADFVHEDLREDTVYDF